MPPPDVHKSAGDVDVQRRVDHFWTDVHSIAMLTILWLMITLTVGALLAVVTLVFTWVVQ